MTAPGAVWLVFIGKVLAKRALGARAILWRAARADFARPVSDDGIAPRSVELCEASAAVNDVKRPSRFEQQRDCLFPFRSEQQARLVRPEVA